MTGGSGTVLVIGATSDIGRAIARRLAADGYALQLAARDATRLEEEAVDIRSRSGAAVTTQHCDVLETDGGGALLARLDPLPDVAICAVGLLGDQRRSEQDGAAAERVMRTNYVYGSAKAGFTAFLSGLRSRLARSGVHVLTVKPGFVRTRMTAGMNLPARLTATPDEVATAVAEALRTGRDVVYVRRIWRLIMLAVRAIPERVFKRMKM